MYKTVANKTGGEHIILEDDKVEIILNEWRENAITANKQAKIDARKNAYGIVEDQLDMMYWDKVNGTEKWKEHITRVKANYPLDGS